MSQFNSIASRNIRHAITAQNTNNHAVSRKTGISYTTLNRKLESGGFTLDDLERIADALDVEPIALLKDAA